MSCGGGRSIARRGTCSSAPGYGERILHRTGHSLGENVHGNGVHMDDYETHDDRRMLPGTGFTVEPGLYFETFGVRTEINVFRGSARRWSPGRGRRSRDARVGVASIVDNTGRPGPKWPAGHVEDEGLGGTDVQP